MQVRFVFLFILLALFSNSNHALARRIQEKSDIPALHNIREINADRFILNNPYLDLTKGKHVIVNIGSIYTTRQTAPFSEKAQRVNEGITVIGLELSKAQQGEDKTSADILAETIPEETSLIRFLEIGTFGRDAEKVVEVLSNKLMDGGILVISNRPLSERPDVSRYETPHDFYMVYQKADGRLIPKEICFPLSEGYPTTFLLGYIYNNNEQLKSLFSVCTDTLRTFQAQDPEVHYSFFPYHPDYRTDVRDDFLTAMRELGYDVEYRTYLGTHYRLQDRIINLNLLVVKFNEEGNLR